MSRAQPTAAELAAERDAYLQSAREEATPGLTRWYTSVAHDKLRALLARPGQTAEKLAKALGRPQAGSTLRQLKRGRSPYPEYPLMRALVRFGIDWLDWPADAS